MRKLLSLVIAITLSISFLSFSSLASELPPPSTLGRQSSPPDVLTMLDGTKVTTPEQWEQRQKEIRNILEYYMYGPWRDGSGEKLSYTISGDTLGISVEYGGNTANFDVTVTIPTVAPPKDGYPVIVVFGWIGEPQSYALSKGYAIISINPNVIADDGITRGGEFYKLYPYGSTWQEQSGVLMGWSWGASKVLDALEQGAGAELGISTKHTIITGISRYGKAAAVAGAFDTGFSVTMPVCSGFGGLTMGRYKSNNLTYNLLPDFKDDPKSNSVGDLSSWTSVGGTEGIQGLQGSGWFNEVYRGFISYSQVPFDQHFLSALCAMDGRYLFMVSGINSDMWNSPPGLWYNYEEVLPAFELLGLEDNLAIQLHLNLHGIEIEDLLKLIAYTDYHWFGKSFDTGSFTAPWNDILADFTLDDLKTCIFSSEDNIKAYEEGKPDADVFEGKGHPDADIPVEIKIGDVPVEVIVSRNTDGDALISTTEGGNGFKFKYGANLQYSKSFAKFDITLPPDLKISDFESVSFVCQTNANYWGKKMAVIAAPKSTGLPSEFEYDYGSGAITPDTITVLATNYDLPPITMEPFPLLMEFNKDVAQLPDNNELECSIYIHMEHLDGDAEYIISDIMFNPHDGVVVDYTEATIAATESTSEKVDTVIPTQSNTSSVENNGFSLVTILALAIIGTIVFITGVVIIVVLSKKKK